MSWWNTLLGRGFSPQTTSATRTTEVDPDLARWLEAAYDAGSWDEGSERQATDRLRERGADGVAAVSQAFWAHPEDHALRWAAVRCASDIGGTDAEDFLAEVLAGDLGPETSRDVHHFSSVAEASSQRMQAVRGLAAGAATGNERASGALAAALGDPIDVVRYAAYVAVRELPDEVRRSASVAPALQRAEREFGDVGVADVADQPLSVEELETSGDHRPPPVDGVVDRHTSTRRGPRISGHGRSQ